MEDNLHLAPGMKDILPDEHTYFTFIKKVVRHRCRQSGYRRITPCLLQSTDMYKALFGEDNEILKNAYQLKKNKQDFTLSYDLIIDMARAYAEHNMQELAQPVELYALESVYRPLQVGDSEHKNSLQFAVQAIGESDSAVDAQVIFLAWRILKDLGIQHQVSLQINTIGDHDSMAQYMEDLRNFYSGKEHVLGKEGTKLLETNPLQLLSSDDEDLQILAQMAPKMDAVLTKDAKKYHQQVLEYLDELGIEYTENPQLVPQHSHQTKTIFEFWDKSKEQSAPLISGGRFNDLIEKLGGEATPAVGFSASFELLEDLMKREDITIKNKDTVHVFVAQLGVEAKKKCMSLLMKLREAGIHAVGALGKGSMREQLSLAEKFKAPWCILMGQIEVMEEIAIIRNMKQGSQEIVRYDDAIDELIARVGEDELDKYTVGVEETVYKDGEEIEVEEE